MIKAPTPYLNETLPDTTRRDALRKNVNRIYLDSWCKQQFTFSAVENDSLNDYAYGNPYALGDAVFTARVLLGLDPDRMPLPESAVAEPREFELKKITFYPNPASDKVCFSVFQENASNEISYDYCINDVFGRLVDKGQCHIDGSGQCIRLSSHLSAGLYLIQVLQQQTNIGTGKILIRK